jgi:small conductance mechanosensitive channel
MFTDTVNPEAVTSLATDVASDLNTTTSQASSFFDSLFGGLSWSKIIAAAILLVLCVVFIKLLMHATDRMLKKSKLEKTVHTFIRSAVKIVLVFVAIMLVAGTLGVNTSSLLALLSVVGLAVSLSIQNSLSNLASAVLILTTKPIKTGDYIEVKGKAGTVLEIGVIYTKISTFDSQLIYIPNSEITSNEITNTTAAGKRRLDLKITASYDCPTEKVKAALLRALQHPKLLPGEPVFARVSGYGESAIEYTVRVWTSADDYWDVYYDVLENVKTVFDEEGIVMTYPHLNVHTIANLPAEAEKPPVIS